MSHDDEYEDIGASYNEFRRQLDLLEIQRSRLLVKIQLFQELSAEAMALQQELEDSLEEFATIKAAITSLKEEAKAYIAKLDK
jgi:hypothetical protein